MGLEPSFSNTKASTLPFRPRWYLVSNSYVPHIIQAQVYYRNSNTFIFSQFCLNSQLKKFLRQVCRFDTIPAEYNVMLRVAVPNKSQHI